MLDRRSFLALAPAGAVLAGGCGPAGAPVTTGATPPPAAPPASAPHAELEEATIAGLAARMARGEITAEALAASYLARIDALDRRGPALRSVIETNHDALAVAAALDAERRAGKVRGPLHGIPVLLKDNVDTADRMTTTAGSLALEGHIAAKDAFLAARLRAAGAVILGAVARASRSAQPRTRQRPRSSLPAHQSQPQPSLPARAAQAPVQSSAQGISGRRCD